MYANPWVGLGSQPSRCLGRIYVGGNLSDGGTFYYLTADDSGNLYRIAPAFHDTIRHNIEQANTNRIAVNGTLYEGNNQLPGASSVPILDDIQGIGTLVSGERITTTVDAAGCPGAAPAPSSAPSSTPPSPTPSSTPPSSTAPSSTAPPTSSPTTVEPALAPPAPPGPAFPTPEPPATAPDESAPAPTGSSSPTPVAPTWLNGAAVVGAGLVLLAASRRRR